MQPAPHHCPPRMLLAAAGIAAIAVMVAACADSSSTSLGPQIGQKAPDTYRPGQPYQLSAEELGLDCKKLTGRMQIKILQVRDASIRSGGSVFARTTQSAVTPVFGGTSRGADPSADYARDHAMLEAMNKQLAVKNCATFDLESELQPRSLRDTPTPIPKK